MTHRDTTDDVHVAGPGGYGLGPDVHARRVSLLRQFDARARNAGAGEDAVRRRRLAELERSLDCDAALAPASTRGGGPQSLEPSADRDGTPGSSHADEPVSKPVSAGSQGPLTEP